MNIKGFKTLGIWISAVSFLVIALSQLVLLFVKGSALFPDDYWIIKFSDALQIYTPIIVGFLFATLISVRSNANQFKIGLLLEEIRLLRASCGDLNEILSSIISEQGKGSRTRASILDVFSRVRIKADLIRILMGKCGNKSDQYRIFMEYFSKIEKIVGGDGLDSVSYSTEEIEKISLCRTKLSPAIDMLIASCVELW